MSESWVHIIGAGVSGLSLAAQLAQHQKLPGLVKISDPYLDQAKSQTFCFWFNEEEYHWLQPEKSWSRWQFSTPKHQHIHHGQKYKYGMVSGERFRSSALHTIRSHPQIELVKEKLEQKPIAQHVFDSRPPRVDHFYIKQSFIGFEIEGEHGYDLEQVALMDDLSFAHGGLRFKYLLPITRNRILVEYTLFTQQIVNLDEFEAESRKALAQDCTFPFTHLRLEKAHIPMGLKSSFSSWGMPIGTRAGMSRDATGYGFVEMQRWARHASQQLMSQNYVSPYRGSRLRAWMDTCLLRLIEHRPELSPQLFMELARFLSGDQFAQFMMRCQFSDAISMMLRAPKRSFFLSAMGKPQWI